MPELSVEERLKIAEEMWCKATRRVTVVELDDMHLEYDGSHLRAWKPYQPFGPYLATTEPVAGTSMFLAMIDCIHLARQKLAQEAAEAELPECAKKWRAGLKNVIATLECIHDIESTRPVSAAALQFARQALES